MVRWACADMISYILCVPGMAWLPKVVILSSRWKICTVKLTGAVSNRTAEAAASWFGVILTVKEARLQNPVLTNRACPAEAGNGILRPDEVDKWAHLHNAEPIVVSSWQVMNSDKTGSSHEPMKGERIVKRKFCKEPLSSLTLKVAESTTGVKSGSVCFTNRSIRDP